jgi:hypothetical protein
VIKQIGDLEFKEEDLKVSVLAPYALGNDEKIQQQYDQIDLTIGEKAIIILLFLHNSLLPWQFMMFLCLI